MRVKRVNAGIRAISEIYSFMVNDSWGLVVEMDVGRRISLFIRKMRYSKR